MSLYAVYVLSFPRLYHLARSDIIAVVRKIEPAASRSKDKRSASLWLNTSAHCCKLAYCIAQSSLLLSNEAYP